MSELKEPKEALGETIQIEAQRDKKMSKINFKKRVWETNGQ